MKLLAWADMRAWVTSSGCLPLYCPDPLVYCTAKLNSQGCLPAVGYVGHPTLSGLDDFVVQASNVLSNRNGVHFYGFAQQAAPFQGGTLCVATPLQRTALQSSLGTPPPQYCSGSYAYAWTHSRLTALGAGTTVYAQFWSRDPGSPSGSGLTDAVSFTICDKAPASSSIFRKGRERYGA